MIRHPAALSIDFGVPRPTVGQFLGWIALSLALLSFVWVAWISWDIHQSSEAMQSTRSRLLGQARQPAMDGSPEAQQKLKDELNRAAQVIDRLDSPWADLFVAVESAFDEKVTLLSVEPDTERQEVRLTAEAKDLPSLLNYLKEIRKSSVLGDAYLASHQTNLQDPQRPVRFVLLAHWNRTVQKASSESAEHVHAEGPAGPQPSPPVVEAKP